MLAPLFYTQRRTIASIKCSLNTLKFNSLDPIYIVWLTGERIRDLWFYEMDLGSGRTRLFRWFRSNARFLLDRWDEEEKEWVHDPDLLDATGIGGDWWAYDRISEEEVIRRLTPTLGKEAAEKTTREVSKQSPIPRKTGSR